MVAIVSGGCRRGTGRSLAANALAARAKGPAASGLPVLSEPVTDLAGVIDAESSRDIDRVSRALQAATGDAIVVVTVDSVGADYGDIREYANELFENHGRGIGEKGKDNGLLVLVAVKDRRVWVEVGYGLEGIITDGFAGETSRLVMAPAFREGDYGRGLRGGVGRLAARIAEARGVTIEDLPVPGGSPRPPPGPDLSWVAIIFILVLLLLIASATTNANSARRRGRRRHYWGGGPWSGWTGGGFGGTFGGGGGFSGGGFGGFGGFGGGSSGGGGGGASW